MLEEKLARVMKLVEQRDKINAELAELLGTGTPSKRGRPRKEPGAGEIVMSGRSQSHSMSVSETKSTGTGNGSE